ncbi:MAG TPA: glycosyl hydrolase family 65 protein, partial [Acidimicrobiales bacterium]|nr:glycosyl hydrolase family 65 protein [Acidimicrobiales bacterium]
LVCAWVTARADRTRSWSLFTQALDSDLADIQGGTTREGIHLGAMAGTIDLAERCYLGLETRDDALWFNPRLPDEITRLRTSLAYRGHRLQVTATHTDLTVAASPCDAAPATVYAAGRRLAFSGGQSMIVTLSPAERAAPDVLTATKPPGGPSRDADQRP